MVSNRHYKQLYFLLFAPIALQFTYLNLYFQRRGLGHGELGTLNAVASAVGIVSPLIFGHLADRLHHKRPVILWLSLGSAVLFGAHYFGAGMGFLLLVGAGLALCRSPLIPLVDALCLDELDARGDHEAHQYAPLRLWGSIGFIVAATVFPLVLTQDARVDPVTRLWPVFAGATVLGLLMTLRTANMADPAKPERPLEYDEPAGSLMAVLRVPKLKRLIILLLVGWMANCAYYLFLSLYLEDIGVADRWKGVYWSMGVVAEVIFLANGRTLLRWMGVRRMLLLGMLGRAARLFAFSVVMPPLVVLFIVQPLHALAFAALHLGTMAFLAQAVPERQRAMGQTVVTSVVGGMGGVLGNLMAGWLSDLAKAGGLTWLTSKTGMYAAFLLAGWLHAGVCVVAWFWLRDPEPRAEAAGAEAGAPGP